MQELHAVNNGDGTYSIQVLAVIGDGVRKYVKQYVAQGVHIFMDCTLDELQTRQTVHVQVNDNGEQRDFNF